jgi:prepilin-type processing-associated H-X9-DG protein
VLAIIGVLIGLLFAAVQHARAGALRTHCQNHLRQIGLALQLYHDSHGGLPPGNTVLIDGTYFRHLGWEARILPHMDQGNLWYLTQQAFRAQQAFFVDPPHVGLSTVVGAYTCPADSRSSTVQTYTGIRVALTDYLGVEGTNQRTNDGVLFMDSNVRLTDIIDGTGNTIMVGERPPSPDHQFGWWYAGVGQDDNGSCDTDLGVREINRKRRGRTIAECSSGPYSFKAGSYDDRCDAFHFWSLHAGGAHFLFCDGAVRFLTYAADPILLALATRAGGEAVTVPD